MSLHAQKILAKLHAKPSAKAVAPWFHIEPAARVKAEDGEEKSQTVIYLYDVIDPFWGVNAQEFVEALEDIDSDTILLRINSPGGFVWDGMAIYNGLLRHKAKIVAEIDGIAASMASVIALAADEVRMADNARYMIHNPWGFAVGDAAEFRKVAEVLEGDTRNIAKIYEAKTGLPEDEIKAMMDAETWFDAATAKEKGFVDNVIDALPASKVKARAFDLTSFKNAPVDLAQSKTPEPTEDDFDRAAATRRAQARLRLTASAIEE